MEFEPSADSWTDNVTAVLVALKISFRPVSRSFLSGLSERPVAGTLCPDLDLRLLRIVELCQAGQATCNLIEMHDCTPEIPMHASVKRNLSYQSKYLQFCKMNRPSDLCLHHPAHAS